MHNRPLTGQHAAVMHPFGHFHLRPPPCGSTVGDRQACSALRNPARSHHPVFPEWVRDSVHLRAVVTTCIAKPASVCIPAVEKQKKGVGRNQRGGGGVHQHCHAAHQSKQYRLILQWGVFVARVLFVICSLATATPPTTLLALAPLPFMETHRHVHSACGMACKHEHATSTSTWWGKR
jgi:hypothetical protein